MLFLASAGFRRVHVGASGTANLSPNSVLTGNIRILRAGVLFLASARFRRPPRDPGVSMTGRRARQPTAQTLERPEVFGFYGVYAIFSIRELPLAPCVSMSGRPVRKPEVQKHYPPGIFGFYGGFMTFLASVIYLGLPACP